MGPQEGHGGRGEEVFGGFIHVLGREGDVGILMTDSNPGLTESLLDRVRGCTQIRI